MGQRRIDIVVDPAPGLIVNSQCTSRLYGLKGMRTNFKISYKIGRYLIEKRLQICEISSRGVMGPTSVTDCATDGPRMARAGTPSHFLNVYVEQVLHRVSFGNSEHPK